MAGAIRRGLGPGDLLVASRIAGAEISYDPRHHWRDRMLQMLRRRGHNARAAPLASVDQICRGPAQKRALAETTGASAVDMESAALAAEARRHKLDLLVVRAIADTLDDTLPAAVTEHTDNLGPARACRLSRFSAKTTGPDSRADHLASRYRKAIHALKIIAADLKTRHFLYDDTDQRH